MQNYSIHWFRRDLRIEDNSALLKNIQEIKQGSDTPILFLFCFDKTFLEREDFSYNRFLFFLKTLKVLKEELHQRGGDLLVLDKKAKASLSLIFDHLKKNKKPLPKQISFNRDYEPFARTRDREIQELLESHQIKVITEKDHLVLEPHQTLKEDGNPYQIFTPFSKKWQHVFKREQPTKHLTLKNSVPKITIKWSSLLDGTEFNDALTHYISIYSQKCNMPIPDGGFKKAHHQLNLFKDEMGHYDVNRDIPSLQGTSRLSIFFKNGSLTIGQCIRELSLDEDFPKDKTSRHTFLKELIWREFYYHVLWHRPDVETGAFNLKYKNIKWENNLKWFEAWKKGETGFPIIDAGMRQLNETGWMHNRVRMIVASFLTKDLLIDWRWGEKYFMQYLLDGDLAPNNGGWQWAASTGCDPQPYFRIFNPLLQSKKFDPQGNYIRKWVPELKGLDAKKIHQPPPTKNYPQPIVNHAAQKLKALRLYKS